VTAVATRRLTGGTGVILAVVAAALALLPAAPAAAHPLGNFTVNRYTGLRIGPDRIDVEHILDLAEIPAFQARQAMDANGDGQTPPPEIDAWRDRRCGELAAGLHVVVDGQQLQPEVVGARLSLRPGAGAPPTLRLECTASAPVGSPPTGDMAGARTLVFRDTNEPDQIGWREVTAVGDETVVTATDVPDRSVSGRLTRYPSGMLAAPLDQRSARVSYRVGDLAGTSASDTPAPGASSAAAPDRRPSDGYRLAATLAAFAARQRLTAGIGLAAVAVALLLGALHALAPGHGKTIVAAYLLGDRGPVAHALVIGGTITVTHTVGVLVLGLVLTAATTLAAERVYPWIGLVSGLLLIALGVNLLRAVLPGDQHHRDHDHQHHHPHPYRPALVRGRRLMAVGLVGGLSPSPSALVVLLAGVAVHRVWFGLLLVVAYGVGMAAALAGIGLLLARTHGALLERTARFSGLLGRVPAGAGALAILGGLLLAARNAVQI
jgi:nickel/cobalt exporter